MQRRFALPLFAAACLAALPGMAVAQQTNGPNRRIDSGATRTSPRAAAV